MFWFYSLFKWRNTYWIRMNQAAPDSLDRPSIQTQKKSSGSGENEGYFSPGKTLSAANRSRIQPEITEALFVLGLICVTSAKITLVFQQVTWFISWGVTKCFHALPQFTAASFCWIRQCNRIILFFYFSKTATSFMLACSRFQREALPTKLFRTHTHTHTVVLIIES